MFCFRSFQGVGAGYLLHFVEVGRQDDDQFDLCRFYAWPYLALLGGENHPQTDGLNRDA